jgi:hypothetical protein
LAQQVSQLQVWRHATAYQKLGSALPGVLSQAMIATHTASGEHEREQAYSLLTMTYRAANTMAHKLGYTDLSLTALDRMEWAASHSGDPLLGAITDYVRAGALTRIGEHEGAARLLNRRMDSLRPNESDPTTRAIIGCLHMKVIGIYGSMADKDTLNAHYAEAKRIATETGGDRMVYETVFGQTNVALNALSAKIDVCEPGEAMELAQQTHIPKGPRTRARKLFLHRSR